MNKTNATCPHCGQSIIMTAAPLVRRPQQGGRWRANSLTMHSSAASLTEAAPTATAAGDWQRITPVGRLEPRDITTAIYDAAISFGLITVGGVAVAWWLEWPLAIGPASGFSVAMWRYFGGIRLAQGLLETVESLTNKDINKDGHIGSPEPARPQPVPLEIIQKSEAGLILRMFRFELPAGISTELFTEWARGVLMVDDLTQARWVSKDKFARDDYTDLLGKLAEANIVRRSGRAKNASYSLTRHGKNALRHYLDTHSHSLTHMQRDFTTEQGGGG